MKPAPEAARPPMLRKVRPKSDVQNLSKIIDPLEHLENAAQTPAKSCGLHGGDGGGAEDGEEEQDAVLAAEARVEQRTVQGARRDCNTQHRHTRSEPASLYDGREESGASITSTRLGCLDAE